MDTKRSTRLISGMVLILMVLSLSLGTPSMARAANTFTVDNLDDTGVGSLRQAINEANGIPGDDTINFSVTGTIHLLSQLENIDSNVQIIGPGAAQLTISGNNSGRASIRG